MCWACRIKSRGLQHFKLTGFHVWGFGTRGGGGIEGLLGPLRTSPFRAPSDDFLISVLKVWRNRVSMRLRVLRALRVWALVYHFGLRVQGSFIEGYTHSACRVKVHGRRIHAVPPLIHPPAYLSQGYYHIGLVESQRILLLMSQAPYYFEPSGPHSCRRTQAFQIRGLACIYG